MTCSPYMSNLVVLLSLLFLSTSATGCCTQRSSGEMRSWEQLVALTEHEPRDRFVRIETTQGVKTVGLLTLETRIVTERGRVSPWFHPSDAAADRERIAVAISDDRVFVFRRSDVAAIELRALNCTRTEGRLGTACVSFF